MCNDSYTDVAVGVNRAIDILFVIDNSGSMANEQDALVRNFERFIAVLENVEGGLPDLHIGVVSTDMGVGRFDAISNCTAFGDAGSLQALPRGPCTGPDGMFIRDVATRDGGRERNYTGSLSDTFGCIARLGTDGCGFEQPLAAMRAALDGSNLGNSGFLRDGAALMVVFITDEDDCSVPADDLFDTKQTSVEDPLGSLSSFRCFEFGVECSPDQPRRQGAHADCRAREDSPLVHGIEDYVTFLKGLKPDPAMVMVSGIVGDAEPVMVDYDSGGAPMLEPSCVSPSGSAVPAIRLTQFIGKFGLRGTTTTICNGDLSDGLILIADTLAQTLAVPCVYGDIDLDPASPGLQTECSVADVRFVGQQDQDEVPLPQCTSTPPGDTELPCWYLKPAPDLCGAGDTGAMLVVERGDYPAPSSTVRVRCRQTGCE